MVNVPPKYVEISGRRLAEARNRRALSQAELATLCGITSQQVSNIERKETARVYLETFGRIAKALQVTADEARESLSPRAFAPSATVKHHEITRPVDIHSDALKAELRRVLDRVGERGLLELLKKQG